MTQGQIGYMMETALERSLAEAGLERNFLTVITMVEVDADDPLFQNPTKPIGPFYTDEEAAKKSYAMVTHRQGDAAGDRLSACRSGSSATARSSSSSTWTGS